MVFLQFIFKMKNVNYDVKIGNVEGDRLINNLIISQLNINNNETSINKVNININTDIKK